jgi:hypothetical protein
MNRKQIRNWLSALFVIATLPGASVVMASQPQQWDFKVYLDDKWIGYHNFRLTPDGNGGHTLDINAQFDVKFLFINAYSYRHDNTERWQQQCLKSIQARTDDNGKEFVVQGASDGSRFYLDNAGSRKPLSTCVMTFAYWDPAILKADRLLNSQTGEYVNVDVLPLGREQIPVRGQPIAANRYRILAEDNAVIDLWYSADSYRWLALQSTTEGGRKIRYLMD